MGRTVNPILATSKTTGPEMHYFTSTFPSEVACAHNVPSPLHRTSADDDGCCCCCCCDTRRKGSDSPGWRGSRMELSCLQLSMTLPLANECYGIWRSHREGSCLPNAAQTPLAEFGSGSGHVQHLREPATSLCECHNLPLDATPRDGACSPSHPIPKPAGLAPRPTRPPLSRRPRRNLTSTFRASMSKADPSHLPLHRTPHRPSARLPVCMCPGWR